MLQLNIPFKSDDAVLKEYIEKKSARQISLVITDNSTSMLSIKNKNSSVFLRLHRMFLSADNNVLDEIVRFIKNRKIKTPLVRDFIKRNTDYLKAASSRRINIRMQGKYSNLKDIYSSINDEYFHGNVSALITWGAKRPARAAARRTLGSFSNHNELIRINPILDSQKVPRYFLEFIVYHEMLHADIGIDIKAGRRSFHGGEFKRREKLFKHYNRAITWERKRY